MSLAARGEPPPLLDRPPPLPRHHPLPLRTLGMVGWLGLLLFVTLDLYGFGLATLGVWSALPALLGYLFAHGRLAQRINAGILTALFLAYMGASIPPYWWG